MAKYMVLFVIVAMVCMMNAQDVSQTTVSSMSQDQQPSSNITIARPIIVMPVLARPILPPRLYWLIVKSQNRTTTQMEQQQTTPSSLSS